ncbi:hypothetical protein KQX54_006275 [Cotesia glomerata]|uniref:Uncharacterized protein n=1 Tax=Cotesia glomerata TaxID=32391 RepID=A0AAV7ICY0_COTGL|nr:hypothetical protein KQX54_006275 [Cotesia glomerata]
MSESEGCCSLKTDMVWSRPPGDLKVWDSLEITNAAGKKLRFVIQEIPEDRYEEALDHLCDNYLRYEDMRMSLEVVNDTASVAYNRAFWKTGINQEISICTLDVTENNKVPVLAGLNILRVIDKDTSKIKRPVTSDMVKTQKIINYVQNAAGEADPCERYGVDYFLTGTGKKVGETYNIPVTSTMFSSLLAQKTAAKARFVDFLERGWDEATDDHGEPLFPGLKSLRWKQMDKVLL